MKMRLWLFFAALMLALMGGSSSAFADPAPRIYYTDIVSGPISGGENNLGGYLSIFGTNFGAPSGIGTTTKVFIGNVEVANYRYLGTSTVSTKLTVSQLTVQVGNLGNPALGQPLPIKVVVNGLASNVDQSFTPNPGRVLFVSLTGNDASAVANDISHPWRNLETPSYGGIYGAMSAGDQIVIRGGHWTDTGSPDQAWLRFRYPQQQGSAPTGVAGTGWIHFTAYPGPINGNAVEDVHYSTPAGTTGGIQGANSAYYGTTGDWVSISNLRMDIDAAALSDAAPINLQYSAGPWRVVNNALGPWPSTIQSLAAGVSGHGNNTKVFGNNIYGMASTGSLENHGIYVDSGGSNWEIAYNWVHDISGGNLLQFFDNVGLAGNQYVGFPPNWLGFTGMQVHHNWMENSGKYGLNIADSWVSGAIWNNVIAGATYSGLRINVISQNMDTTVAYNTFYNNDQQASGSGNGQVLNTWGNYNPTGTIRIYDNIFAAGPATLANSSAYANSGSDDAYLDFKRNLYWDNGSGWSHLARDASALYVNPAFNNATNGDLSLAAGSAAIDAGIQAVPIAVTDDFTGRLRPQGAANDLGAFESLPGQVVPTNGICGTANGATFTTVPTAGLCSSGSASTLAGSGPWTWSCAGSNGGTTASCSASRGAAIPAPVNTALPSISGTPVVGNTLACSPGAWSNAPSGYAFQWFEGSVGVSGATASSYIPVTADVGKTLVCTVTASNTGGSSSATSAATVAVTAAPVKAPQVAQAAAPVYGASTTRPVKLSFPGAVQAGDVILVAMSSTQGHTYNFTVSDNKGNGNYTWYPLDACQNPTCSGWFYVVAKTGGSSFTISIAGGNAQDTAVAAYEIANAASDIFDGTGTSAAGTSASAKTSPVTSQANSLVFSVFGGNTGQSIVPNHAAGAVSYTKGANMTFGAQYVLAAFPGTTSMTWSVAQSKGWLQWAETSIAIKGGTAKAAPVRRQK